MVSSDEVIWMYRLLLGREPENPDVIAVHTTHASLLDMLRSFLRSQEFRDRSAALELFPIATSGYPLDQAPPMDIAGARSDESSMWRAVAASWESFGQSDPYWSVLTDDRWRMSKMTDVDKIEAFYATGQHDLERLGSWLRRAGLKEKTNGVCVEYGCGVGRVTEWLARRYRKVRAFDISKSHIDAAQRRFASKGVKNVEFVHVKGPADLDALGRCDMFFSTLVLQHNPPPIIRSILKVALRGLNRSGIAFFQVPTYMADYRFNAREYVDMKRDGAFMEMHCIPQSEVFQLLQEANCILREVQPDGFIGNHGIWISNTFLAGRLS